MAEISVIVPVYKAEAYLPDCIESILAQTFSDFEVILVDDGSPDNGYAICQEYASRDERIQVMQQENQGQAAARNHALQQAKGQWICFVDSDDLIHPQMLQLLYDAAESSAAPISMCEMLESPVLPEGFSASRECVFETLPMDEKTLTELHDREEYPAWVACAKLIRKELIMAYPFREGRVYEDNEAVCRWVCQGGSVSRTKEKLYFYRTNPGSTTKSHFSLKKLDYLWALESIIHYYGQLQYPVLQQRFVDRYVEAVAGGYLGAKVELNRLDVAKQVEKDAKRFLRRENIHLTQDQFSYLLDNMHPEWIRIYWPVAGLIRTLREDGVSGIGAKIKKRLGKGDAK